MKGKQIKKVAACCITNGVMGRSKKARALHNGKIIHEGMASAELAAQ